MKTLIRLAVLAVVAKIAYELVQRQRAGAPMPEAAPYEPAPYEPVATPSEPGASSDTTGDDLTEISGIGPVYAERLAGAGITTFRALVETDPGRLADVAETTAAAVAEWQAQARQRDD